MHRLNFAMATNKYVSRSLTNHVPHTASCTQETAIIKMDAQDWAPGASMEHQGPKTSGWATLQRSALLPRSRIASLALGGPRPPFTSREGDEK